MSEVDRTKPGSKNDWRITYDTGSQKWTDDRPGDGVGESGPEMMKETLKDPSVRRGLDSISNAVESGKGLESAVKAMVRDVGEDKTKTILNALYKNAKNAEAPEKIMNGIDQARKMVAKGMQFSPCPRYVCPKCGGVQNVRCPGPRYDVERVCHLCEEGIPADHPDRLGESIRRMFEAAGIKDKVDLRREYNKFNAKYFNGELPNIKLTWSKTKSAGGQAVGLWNKLTGVIIPKEIKISTFLEMDRDRFDKIMLHEMVHIWQYVNGINEREKRGHGRTFQQKAKEIGNKAGIIIPLTEDISGMEVSEDVKATQYVVVLWERNGQKRMSMFMRGGFDKNRTNIEKYFQGLASISTDFIAKFYTTQEKGLMKLQAMRGRIPRSGVLFFTNVDASLIDAIRKNGRLIGEIKKKPKNPEQDKMKRWFQKIGEQVANILTAQYETRFIVNTTLDGERVVCQIVPVNPIAKGLIRIQGIPPDDMAVFVMKDSHVALWIEPFSKYPTPRTVTGIIDRIYNGSGGRSNLYRALGFPIAGLTASQELKNRVAGAFVASNWGRAFRQDYKEPEPMSGSDLQKVKSVKLVKNPERRTWWMVYDRKGNYLGQVRTTVGGYQEYMVGDSKDKKIGGMYRTDRDPDHAYAILALLGESGS